MRTGKLIKNILKSAVYLMDNMDRVSDRITDRASDIADSARSVIYPNEGQTMRNVLSFVAGVGVGVAAGMLLAPSSGEELRSTISDKVQNISDQVRGRAESYATGTDVR